MYRFATRGDSGAKPELRRWACQGVKLGYNEGTERTERGAGGVSGHTHWVNALARVAASQSPAHD
jgi:hypothetical protein